MMFILIYYAPPHLALSQPHTITELALPYLLIHFSGRIFLLYSKVGIMQANIQLHLQSFEHLNAWVSVKKVSEHILVPNAVCTRDEGAFSNYRHW